MRRRLEFWVELPDFVANLSPFGEYARLFFAVFRYVSYFLSFLEKFGRVPIDDHHTRNQVII